MVAPIYIWQQYQVRFLFLHILTNTCCLFCVFNSSCYNKYDLIFHYGFDFHFPDLVWFLGILSTFSHIVGHMHIFYEQMSVQMPKFLIRFLDFVGILHSLNISPLWGIWLKYFLPYCRLTLILLSVSFVVNKLFRCNHTCFYFSCLLLPGFGDTFKNCCSRSMLRSLTLLFSSSSIQVRDLCFVFYPF